MFSKSAVTKNFNINKYSINLIDLSIISIHERFQLVKDNFILNTLYLIFKKLKLIY